MAHKLLFTVLSAALLFTNTTQAQPGISTVTKALPKVDLGIKVGANFQQITGEGWENTYKPGIVGGAFVGLHKDSWGIQLEALVKSVTYTVDVANIKSDIKTVYLDVPLLLEYRIIPRLWIQAGPQFSTLFSAKDPNSKDVKDNFKTSDFSGLLGLEVKLPLKFTVGARYVLGFTDINNHGVGATTDAWKNRFIQLYVGFRFL